MRLLTTTRRTLAQTMVAVAVCSVWACSSDRSAEGARDGIASAPAVAPDRALEIATDLGVRNARMPIEGVVTAGQPTPDQAHALMEAGLERFISLRPASEEGAGWEEARAAEGDFRFDRLPIAGEGDLTRENVEAFAALLEAQSEGPTVLYCASSNRVGAMLALKAFWLDGVGADEALELGRAAGLTRLEGAVAERLGIESAR